MSVGSSELEQTRTEELGEADVRLDVEIDELSDGSREIVKTQSPRPIVKPTAKRCPAPHSRPRSRLLAMADGYLQAGSIYQAQEMYFDLMDAYPETVEARRAEDRIMELATRHEQAGELHLARALYERLA